jgi:hypothetical protein
VLIVVPLLLTVIDVHLLLSSWELHLTEFVVVESVSIQLQAQNQSLVPNVLHAQLVLLMEAALLAQPSLLLFTQDHTTLVHVCATQVLTRHQMLQSPVENATLLAQHALVEMIINVLLVQSIPFSMVVVVFTVMLHVSIVMASMLIIVPVVPQMLT